MQTEASIQLAVLRWWALACRGLKCDPRLLVHVPNGGKRSFREAAIFKGMGVRAGFPDLMLLVPRKMTFYLKTEGSRAKKTGVQEYAGLFIELKSANGMLSSEQQEYHPLLAAQGYCVMVAWSFEETVTYITNYLTHGEPFAKGGGQ